MSDEFFKWQPEYSVKIKVIDDQHKELVRIINRLFDAVSKREADKVIGSILDALMDYTKTHFELEERLLAQAEYHELEAHKLEHKKLIADLDRLCKKHMVDDQPIYFQMLGFLKSWLKNHIQGCDTKYSQALLDAGFNVDGWAREATTEFDKVAERSGKWWKIW